MEDLNSDYSQVKSKSVDEVLASGFVFRGSEYLQQGFRTYGNEFGIYTAFTLVYIAASLVLGSIPYVGSSIGLFVNPPLIAGIIFYGHLQRINEFRDFNSFFSGFKQPYWGALITQSIASTFLMAMAVAILVLPPYYDVIATFATEIQKLESIPQEEAGEFIIGLWNPDLGWAMLLAAVGALVVTTFLCMTPYFIVRRAMPFPEAIRASVRVVSKKFWSFAALVLVLWVVLIVGFMMCCVGFLAAFPVYYLTLLAAFEDIMGD
jgi:uncharacterized membrane protein